MGPNATEGRGMYYEIVEFAAQVFAASVLSGFLPMVGACAVVFVGILPRL